MSKNYKGICWDYEDPNTNNKLPKHHKINTEKSDSVLYSNRMVPVVRNRGMKYIFWVDGVWGWVG